MWRRKETLQINYKKKNGGWEMSSFPLNMLPQLKRCLLTLGYNFGLSCQFKITEF